MGWRKDRKQKKEDEALQLAYLAHKIEQGSQVMRDLDVATKKARDTLKDLNRAAEEARRARPSRRW